MDVATSAETCSTNAGTWSKFRRPSDFVLDPFVGTHFTLKACLLMNSQRQFAGCDKDVDCLRNTFPRRVGIYASQLLYDGFYSIGDDKLKLSMRVHPTAMIRGSMRDSFVRWRAPHGLPSIKTFQEHLILFPCPPYWDCSEYYLAPHLPL